MLQLFPIPIRNMYFRLLIHFFQKHGRCVIEPYFNFISIFLVSLFLDFFVSHGIQFNGNAYMTIQETYLHLSTALSLLSIIRNLHPWNTHALLLIKPNSC